MSVIQKPLTARRQVTRERLLAAARSVIRERGLPGASVEEISEKAGFTRGAFYSNFASKDELVVALIEDLTTRRKAAAEMVLPEGLPVSYDAAIRFGIDNFFGSGDTLNEDVVLVTELQLWAVRHPEGREIHAAMVREALAAVVRALDALTAAYGATYRVNPETAVRTLHAALDYYRLRSVLEVNPDLRAKDRMLELFSVLFDVPGEPEARN